MRIWPTTPYSQPARPHDKKKSSSFRTKVHPSELFVIPVKSCAHTRVNNCVCVVGFAFWEWPESCLEAAHREEKRWISGVLFPFRDCTLSLLCNRSWLWFTRIAVLYSLSAVPQLVKSASVQRTVLFSQTKLSSAWATRKKLFLITKYSPVCDPVRENEIGGRTDEIPTIRRYFQWADTLSLCDWLL